MKLSAVTLLTLLAALTACTADVSGDDTAGAQAADVTLTLTMGASHTAASRAATTPRPLTSSDNWQQATNVRLYAFRSAESDGTYTLTRLTAPGTTAKDYLYVPEFNTKQTIWTDETHDEQYELYVAQYLEAGYYYKFLAIGRDDITEADATGATLTATLTPGTTTWDDAVATTTTAAATCSELFTGFTDTPLHHTTTRENVRREIRLSRAVAGLLLYVENVPWKIGGTEVKAVGVAPVEGWHNAVALAPRTVSGTPTQGDAPYLKVLVPDTFTPQGDTDDMKVWANPHPTTTSHPNAIAPHGVFLTPQEALSDYTTELGRTPLVLNYYAADGTILKSRPVLIKHDTPHGGTPTLPSLNNYPILASHIYCLGQRNIGTAADTPLDLTPEPSPVYVEGIVDVFGTWQADVSIQM